MVVGGRSLENRCPPGRLLPGVAATCGFLLLITLYWIENSSPSPTAHNLPNFRLLTSKDQINIDWLNSALRMSPTGLELLASLEYAGESIDPNSFKVRLLPQLLRFHSTDKFRVLTKYIRLTVFGST